MDEQEERHALAKRMRAPAFESGALAGASGDSTTRRGASIRGKEYLY